MVDLGAIAFINEVNRDCRRGNVQKQEEVIGVDKGLEIKE